MQGHSVLIIKFKVKAVSEVWQICLLVVTPPPLSLSLQFEGESAGHLGSNDIVSTQGSKDFYPTSANPLSPSPLLQFQPDLHRLPIPFYT